MANQKLSALAPGGSIISTDLFYSAHDIGGGTFTQVSQAASALKTFVVTSPTLVTPALGTPSSGTLTNCTGLPSIVVANEATDTTCFPSFFTAATGELGPKTNANLTYNSNNGNLSLNQGTMTVSPATGGAFYIIDPDTAAQQAAINLNQTGVTKWVLGKQTDDSFFIFDNPGGTILSAASGGATVSLPRSVVLGGNPTAPTPALGDNDTSIATTAFVRANASVRTQTSFTGTSITLVNEQILNCNCAASPTITLPDAATRLGVPITIIDIGGHALLQPITIQRAGTNTIQDTSTTSITLSNNYAAITLTPSNDGVTVGRWSII